jgi:hypothetical protein
MVEDAPLVHDQFGKYTAYRVITVRKTGGLPESPITFTNDTLYTAKLFAVTLPTNGHFLSKAKKWSI